MGYYTSFSLEYDIASDPEMASPVESFKARLSGLDIEIPDDITLVLDERSLETRLIEYMESNENNYGPWINLLRDDMDSVKWYEWENEMRELSSKFPDVLFTLTGEGEESGDLWKAYFLGGKMQRETAKVSYDPFHADKLS